MRTALNALHCRPTHHPWYRSIALLRLQRRRLRIVWDPCRNRLAARRLRRRILGECRFFAIGQIAPQPFDRIEAEMAPDDVRRHQIGFLRKWVTTQRNTAWEDLGRGPEAIGESPNAAGNRIRLKLVRVQRKVFIEERDAGRIDDEVLRKALRRLDFAEGLTDRDDT